MQKRMLRWGSVLMVALGLWVLMGWLSSAEAVITIRRAEVVNGAAVVQGGNAARGAGISWEGILVTQANNGGNFAFQGVVPADCVGRLEDGAPADAVDVALANCGPVSDVPAPVPQTGQTTSYRPGDDGAIQAGVTWPVPRFTDHGDGTVSDNLTALTWLKHANCFGQVSWFQAIDAANALASGSCGLTDGSVGGDWRLPNIKELKSLFDYSQSGPPLPVGHPFTNIQIAYWASTTLATDTSDAWVAIMQGGGGEGTVAKGAAASQFYGWAVRERP
jgi:hypothetical protein